MRIRTKFLLSSGATIEDETSDFRTIEECQAALCESIGKPLGTLTWRSPAGDHFIFANAHIAAAHLTPVQDQDGATA